MAKSIVFIDTEVGVDDHKIHDIGAVRQDRAYFHSASVRNFVEFIAGAEYICGHNILHHDLKYIHDSLGYELRVATVYKGNIIKNLIMDCQSYTKYRPNETTGGIFVSWRRKEELPTGA